MLVEENFRSAGQYLLNGGVNGGCITPCFLKFAARRSIPVVSLAYYMDLSSSISSILLQYACGWSSLQSFQDVSHEG